jgi:hypothetical protein
VQIGAVGVYYETDSGVIVNKVGSTGSASFATGTSYYGLIGDLTAITDNNAAQTPEISVAGTFKNLHVGTPTNGRTNIATFRTRINGGNGNCVVTIPAGNTGIFTDSTNSDSVAISDNVNYSRVTSSGSGTFILRTIGCEIHYPANEMTLFSCDNGGASYSATAPRYSPITGSLSIFTTEAPSRVTLYGSGTISDYYMNINTNAATASQTYDVGVNSSYGIAIVVGAAGTGSQSNTSDSLSFADGDYLNYRYSKPTGTGATVKRWDSIKVVYDLPAVTFIPQAVWFM